jgi:hypothetical protein
VLGNRVVWVAVNSEERVIDACRTSRDGQGRCIVGAGAASSWTPSRPVNPGQIVDGGGGVQGIRWRRQ